MTPSEKVWHPSSQNALSQGLNPLLLLAFLEECQECQHSTPRAGGTLVAGTLIRCARSKEQSSEPLYGLEGTDLWLHLECRRFWLKAHPEYRANGSDPGPLPILDRTGEEVFPGRLAPPPETPADDGLDIPAFLQRAALGVAG
jgi:hypothetical protein